jgi:hypothetical protein
LAALEKTFSFQLFPKSSELRLELLIDLTVLATYDAATLAHLRVGQDFGCASVRHVLGHLLQVPSCPSEVIRVNQDMNVSRVAHHTQRFFEPHSQWFGALHHRLPDQLFSHGDCQVNRNITPFL